MAFTQVTVSGKVMLDRATPAQGAQVAFTLNTQISDGSQVVVPQAQVATCDATGAFSITLNANDDTTTLPTGSYYTVVISRSNGQQLNAFNVVVPHADAPSVNLFTLAQVSTAAPGIPFVSQVLAGAGITLSPPGGTGAVTISATDTGVEVSSFNGRTGAVVPQSGDYTQAQVSQSVVTKSAAYPLTTSDTVVLVDATSAGFTVTLPTAVGFTGLYVIRAINTNTNKVTVATTNSQTIDGASTTTVGPASSGATWLALELVSDGANWRSV